MDIRETELSVLTNFIISTGDKAFRAKQIQEWIWKKGARSFAELKNIPKSLIEHLQKEYEFRALEISEIQESGDGTAKFSFISSDKKLTEGVLIPSKKRVTACISTQVGCPLRCQFCATGKLGFDRNLSAGEIFDQITLMSEYSNRHFQTAISNIVIMGMGEPFLNFEACSRFIKNLTSPEFKGMSPKRITLSSVGLCDGIYALADLQSGVEFALSLHCAVQTERELLIPVAKTNTLQDITKALKYYHQKTEQRITIEYVLLKDVNDQIKHAQALADFCKSIPVKINIIEFNPTEDISFSKSDEKTVLKFVEFLESKNLIVNVRKSRGKDIAAACGQLAGITKNNNSL
jgi:23S rRNA (adenine2503-C2)-methyltransferase